MQGTIRRNNVLEPMSPYGCYSDTPKLRVPWIGVMHGQATESSPSWPHVMSSKCRYDRKHQDERCEGCKVEYDAEYVANLR